jgi:hypothetical protein
VAELRETFKSGLEVIFDTFEEAVHSGTYTLGSSNDFNEVAEPPTCPVRCVFINFREKDVSLLSFSDLIQPNDILGLIPYDDVTLEVSNEGYFSFTDQSGFYSVVGHEVDPLKVTYTVLMRKN